LAGFLYSPIPAAVVPEDSSISGKQKHAPQKTGSVFMIYAISINPVSP